MTNLVSLTLSPSFAPSENGPLPERLVEGNPVFRTWELDSALAEAAKWGQIRTGIWECTPGTYRAIKGDSFEFCYILSGRPEPFRLLRASYTTGIGCKMA